MAYGAEGAQHDADAAKRLIDVMNAVHQRAPGLPIIALGETATMQGTSPKAVQALRNLHSILYLYEDTVPFLARQIMRAAEDYLENLLPPFFKALTKHVERSAYSWHTPGHAGGVGFLKSPVGYALHEFFGENTLRSDLSISVPELGSLLDHTGPVKAAEAYAAQVFGADHTYFVTNGTSTANKIVWHSMAGRDDLVIVDRNMVGRTTGALQYWKNSGVSGSINFSMEDESYLGLTSTVLRQNIACATSDFDADGKTDLVYGDQSGQLKIISNYREAPDAENATTEITFNALTGSYEARNLGGRTWPTSVNLFATNKPTIVVGNVLGGISVLRHDEGESLPSTPTISIYPNPASKTNPVTIKIDRTAQLQIFSMMGQTLTDPVSLAGNEEYTQTMPYLAAGVYIFRFTTNNKSVAKRVVIF